MPNQMPNQMPVQNKSAGVAALLNLFWGIGYAYLGYKKVLGLPTIAFILIMIVVYFILSIFTIGLATLLLAVVLAYDGYQKGKGRPGFVGAQR